MYKAAVLTISDKGSKGLREDISGQVLQDMLKSSGFDIAAYSIIADEQAEIEQKLIELCDQKSVDLILTTGGTGFSPRDVTPEATLKVIEKQAMGISEAIRQKSLEITPKAMLSRGVSGIRKSTLIINMPGSPKACRESFEVIAPALGHGLDILNSNASECGRS